MSTEEELREEASAYNIDIIDMPFESERIQGLYCDRTIAIRKNLSTAERTCVLAEELGHYHTTVGNIIDQSIISNRKQERTARLWAYNRLIELQDIISGFKSGCRNRYELAEHLGVTEELLQDALDTYKQKYGSFTTVDNYVIYFEPTPSILMM